MAATISYCFRANENPSQKSVINSKVYEFSKQMFNNGHKKVGNTSHEVIFHFKGHYLRENVQLDNSMANERAMPIIDNEILIIRLRNLINLIKFNQQISNSCNCIKNL